MKNCECGVQRRTQWEKRVEGFSNGFWFKKAGFKEHRRESHGREQLPPEQEGEARTGANNKNLRESLEHGDPLGRGLVPVPFQVLYIYDSN